MALRWPGARVLAATSRRDDAVPHGRCQRAAHSCPCRTCTCGVRGNRGPGDFDDAKSTAFRHHLIAHGMEEPMFVHCASGNRVGAALLPWLVLDEGVGEDLALEMAKGMGLKDADITAMAEAYIHAHEVPAVTR